MDAIEVLRRILSPAVAAALATLLLADCTLVPRDAPAGGDIRDGAVVHVDAPAERVPYALVRLSPSIVHAVNDDRTLSAAVLALAHMPKGSGSPARAPVGVGDILTITIFEAQAGGLFIPNEAGSRAGNFVALPNQQVDDRGFVTVPYVGNLRVAGFTAAEVSSAISTRLKSRAIEPQVVVTVTERRGHEVSVLGEVNQPTRFALDPGGVKMSGAIARVGGPKYPDYDTAVSLQRRGVNYSTNLSSIFLDPRLDVQLQGDDILYLSHDPRFVMVFGATLDPTLTSITRRVTFESNKMNLAEAIAKAGGLNTARADARSVFVFRKEPKETLARLGVDVTSYQTNDVPTVFSVDLATADGFFISDAFQLHNRDIIVVSEPPYTDFAKFFSLLNQLATVPTAAASIGVTAAR